MHTHTHIVTMCSVLYRELKFPMTLKILFVGDHGVGKTTLIHRYTVSVRRNGNLNYSLREIKRVLCYVWESHIKRM